MSKTEQYSANLLQIRPFVTRNQANVQRIDAPSFWVNDVEKADDSHEIKVSIASQKNWLKFNQEQGESCTLFPVDGNEGVFIDPPNVKNPDDFSINGKRAGGCEFLLLKDKWLFAEYKIEAKSSNPSQILENRTKASLQLARTLTSFQEQAINLDKTNCKCMIVTPVFFPKISRISIPFIVGFLKKYNVPLEEKTIDDVIKI